MGNEWIIYGMGNVGTELYYFIKLFGGEVLMFADRNQNKIGTGIENTRCISYEDLLGMNKDIPLAVAIYKSDEIEQEFRETGFTNVIGWKDVRRALIERKRGEHVLLDLEEIKHIKTEIEPGVDRGTKGKTRVQSKMNENSLKIVEINFADLVGKRFNGYDLMEELNRRGHHVTQVVKHKTSSDEHVIEVKKDYIEDVKIGIRELESSVSNVWFPYGQQLLELQEVQEADILHFHILHNNFISLLDYPELMRGKGVIWTIHDPWILTGNCIYPLDCEKWKTGCNGCDGHGDHRYEMITMNTHTMWNLKKEVLHALNPHIIVSCGFMKNYIAESPLTKHWDKIHTIPFGVDSAAYKVKLEDKNYIHNKKRIIIGFRAEDMEIKGCRYIYEALGYLDLGDQISIMTVGSGYVPDGIKEKYTVIEKGWIDGEELRDFYSDIDLFLMTSLAETFGMMAIESMAAYTPVLCFEDTVLEEIVNAPVCGIAVPYKDSAALAEAIRKILTGEIELESRAVLGRKLVEEKYSIDNYINSHEELYKKIISEYKGEPFE